MQADQPMRCTRRRGQSGNAIIEFAMVLPMLLLVVFGITEFGRALMTTNVLTAAAREGARVAAVGGDSTAVNTRINAVLTAANVKLSPTNGIVITGPDANRAITVTVASDFNIIPKGVFTTWTHVPTSFRLQGSSVMRFEG
jgi:Flp pilus assembly protein TadG